LLPLFEWLTDNWNALLHEERLPLKNAADSASESMKRTCFPPPALEANEDEAEAWDHQWYLWWSRHALRACRQGGLYPDVVFRRWRDRVEISWGPAKLAGTSDDFRFLESERGSARFPPRVVADVLFEVMNSGVEYLAKQAPASERTGILRERIASLKLAEFQQDQRLSWLAGLGTDESTVLEGWRRLKGYLQTFSDDARNALIDSKRSELVIEGSCQATLMFGSVAPDVKENDALAIARKMVNLYDPNGDPDMLRKWVRAEPLSQSMEAWEQGYVLAQDLLAQFADSITNDYIAIEQLIDSLQIQRDTVDISDDSIRGLAIAGPQHRPGIVVNLCDSRNQHSYGQRFTLAHELCHILFDREVGQRLAIASGPWAPRDIEQRANAFAAMLLMPLPLVSKAIAGLTEPLKSRQGVAEVAQRLQTSFDSTLWHLHNLGYIDDVTQQRIRESVP
jgi:Zn-dependent peptidase ImmA (M78 family)